MKSTTVKKTLFWTTVISATIAVIRYILKRKTTKKPIEERTPDTHLDQ